MWISAIQIYTDFLHYKRKKIMSDILVQQDAEI
jgi:hypothetical protein